MDDTVHPRTGVRASSSQIGVLAALAAECGGGFLPVSDKVIVDAKLLAHCMNVDADTINGWLKKHDVPIIGTRQTRFIDAEVFLSCLTGDKGDGEKASERGGDRVSSRKRKVEGRRDRGVDG